MLDKENQIKGIFVEGYLPYLTRYRRMPMVFIPFENAI